MVSRSYIKKIPQVVLPVPCAVDVDFDIKHYPPRNVALHMSFQACNLSSRLVDSDLNFLFIHIHISQCPHAQMSLYSSPSIFYACGRKLFL